MQVVKVHIHRHNDPVKVIENLTVPQAQKIIEDRDYAKIEVIDQATGQNIAAGLGPQHGEARMIDRADITEGPPVE